MKPQRAEENITGDDSMSMNLFAFFPIINARAIKASAKQPLNMTKPIVSLLRSMKYPPVLSISMFFSTTPIRMIETSSETASTTREAILYILQLRFIAVTTPFAKTYVPCK